jgi:hypothetical protein
MPQAMWGCFLNFNMGVKIKVKVNFTLEQSMKAQRGSRGVTVLFL